MADRTEVYTRLTPIFQEYFEQDDLELNDATQASDVTGWDSLAHIALMVEIEKEFNIRIGIKQSAKLKNLGALVDTILAA